MKLRAAAVTLLLTATLAGSLFAAPDADAGRRDRLPRWVEQPAFSASASELSRAADDLEVDPGAPTKLLLSEVRYDYDDAGVARKMQRSVYQVLKPEVGQWGELATGWDPWRQERPELSARVISPDGEVRVLSADAVREMPASQMGGSMYSDTRILVAALPGIEPGAIVETQIVVPAARSMLDGLAMDRYSFGYIGIPVAYERLIVTTPEGVTPVFKTHDIKMAKREREGDRATWTWSLIKQEPYGYSPAFRPYSMHWTPAIDWTLVSGWGEVAEAYHEIVEAQIGDADLAAIVAEVTEGLTERDDVIAALTARVHRDARYTGLELDEAAVVPRTPAEIFARGYGDCKDKAALLVAMLREAGIEANVVLLRAGTDTDVDPEIPGPNLFNHAITIIPGGPGVEDDVWVDVTAEFHAPGVLPFMDQGRQGLVASPATTGLITLPVAQPKDTATTTTMGVDLRRPGVSSVVYVQSSVGDSGASERDSRDSVEDTLWQESAQDYAEAFLLAEGEVTHFNSDVRALREPFSITFEVPRSRRGLTWGESGSVLLVDPAIGAVGQVFKQLVADELKEREAPVVLWADHQELTATLQLPEGWGGQELPDDVDVNVNGLRYSRSVTQPDPATVVVHTVYDSGGEPLAGPDLVAFITQLAEAEVDYNLRVKLRSEAGQAWDDERYGEALAGLRQRAAANPDDASAAFHYANMLHDLGFVAEARAENDRALALDPELDIAWELEGALHRVGEMGRADAEPPERDAVIAAARKIWALTDSDEAFDTLIELLLTDGHGASFGAGADFAEARALIEAQIEEAEEEDEGGEDRFTGYMAMLELLDGEYDAVIDRELRPRITLTALGCAGRFDEAADLANSLPPEQRKVELEKAANLSLSFSCFAAAARLNDDHESLDLGDWLSKLKTMDALPEPAEDELDERLTRALLANALKLTTPDPALVQVGAEWQQQARGAFSFPKGGYAPMESRAWTEMMLSLGERHAYGDPKVGRVLALSGEAGEWEFLWSAVVQQQGEGDEATWTLVGMGRPAMLRAAAALIEAGDLDAAREIARLAANYTDPEDADLDDPFDPMWLTYLAHAGDLSEPGRAEALVAAGLCITGEEDDMRRGLALAVQAQAAGAPAPPLLRARLYAAGQLGDKEAFAEAAAEMVALLPQDQENVWKIYLANKAGDFATADAILEANFPDARAPERHLALARVAAARDDLATAMAERQEAIKLGDDDPVHYNQLAWYSLFLEEPPEEMLEWGEAAVDRKDYDQGSAHTLAAVHLALGDADAAAGLLVAHLNAQDGRPPGDHWYLILGGIAEAWDMPEAARAAYAQVEPSIDPFTSYALAQRALAQLDAASEP